MYGDKKGLIQKTLEAAVAANEIAGANLLIYKDGKEYTYAQAGMSDIEGNRAIGRDSIFRLYSMSKPITSAAVMKLMEQGKLDLGEPVWHIIPSFKSHKISNGKGTYGANSEVYVKHLLDMTSGYPYPGAGNESEKHSERVFNEAIGRIGTGNEMSTVDFVSKLGEGPALFEAGSAYRYGTSADILGAVVEIVSGMKFGEFLKKEFFEPLGMNDTGFFVPEEKQDRLTCVYDISPWNEPSILTENRLAINLAMDTEPGFESGGAGLVSTCDDYMKFGQMLLNGGSYNGQQILQKSTVDYMTCGDTLPQLEPSFNGNFGNMPGYCYSNLMRIMKYPGAALMKTHKGVYGWDGWLGCYFENDPEANETFIFMTQKKDAGTLPIHRRILDVLRG